MATTETMQERRQAVEQAREKAKQAAERTLSAIKASDVTIGPIYTGLTFGSILLSLALYAGKRKQDAIFVGLWAPTFLGLGLLHKLIASEE